MKRFFNLVLGTLALLAVTVISAFVSMRLAIHGREVEVPNVAGLPVEVARSKAAEVGLNLNMENRFYSAGVPAGRILTQSPAPGSLVRRDGQIRVAESLGGQHVVIPDVMGQSERAASVVLRRLSLELGPVSRIPVPGIDAVVIAQSPPANAQGADTPQVGLLVGEPQPEESAGADDFVMPMLVGLTVANANTRLASAGLHITTAQGPAAPRQPDSIDATSGTPTPVDASPVAAPATPNLAVPLSSSAATAFDVPLFRPAPVSFVITSQTPPAGHRVTRSDTIRVTAVPKASGAPAVP